MPHAPALKAKVGPSNLQQRRALFVAYITFLFIITAAFGLGNLLARDEWTVGDWLINYQGGFVRRGLAGEAALRLGHALHVSPLLFVLLLQLLCYAVIFYAAFLLLSRSGWQMWVLALAFSPATFSFQVMNQAAGFRKELLLLAGLGGLLLLLLRDGKRSDLLLATYMTLLSTVCVLSHEGLFFFLPYLFAGLAICTKSNWRALRIAAVPLLLACATFFAAFRHPGTVNTAKSICRSLGFAVTDALPKPCSGAIAMIGRSAAWSRADTQTITRTFQYVPVYTVAALLALLPIAWGIVSLWQDRRTHRDLFTIAFGAAFSLAGTIVLLIYTVDWGRWIYMHVVCLMFLLLVVEGKRRAYEAPTQVSIPSKTQPLSKLAIVCLTVYATCWSIPHMGSYELRAGYIYLLRSQITAK